MRSGSEGATNATGAKRASRAGRSSTRRLRIVFAVGALLLLVVIAGFIGYAHWRGKLFLLGLPAKLGVDIRQSTDGVTYTQSAGGRALYTIHAAKAIEHGNGTVTLHDVSIILYGRKDGQTDRIAGKEFEYDRRTGEIRATGEVQLDLQVPQRGVLNGAHGSDEGASRSSTGAAHEAASGPAHERVVHVRTSGLVYLQKLGVAATEQPIEFTMGSTVGHATGAEYNSNDGSLILQSAVDMNGNFDAQPTHLTATHAEYHRDAQVVTLLSPVLSTEQQRTSAHHAVAHLRVDNSIDVLDADGDVTIEREAPGGSSQRVTSRQAQAHFDANDKPRAVVLSGGVAMAGRDAEQTTDGTAQRATASFSDGGMVRQVVLTGAVALEHHGQSPAAGADSASNRHDALSASQHSASKRYVPTVDGAAVHPLTTREDRTLQAQVVTLDFAETAGGKAQMRTAHAVGHASVTEHAAKQKPSTPVLTEMAADDLLANFMDRPQDRLELQTLHGTGHTALHRILADGTDERSSGDAMEITMRDAGGSGPAEVAMARQTGSVHMAEDRPATAKAQAVAVRATAGEAFFDGASQHVTLSGAVALFDAGSVLETASVVFDRVTGDATAEGDVHGSILQSESALSGDAAGGRPRGTLANRSDAEPMHVRAQRAVFHHAEDRVIFTGSPGNDARLWQRDAQLQASTIEYDRQAERLFAHGNGSVGSLPVHTVFLAQRTQPAKTGTADGRAVQASGTVSSAHNSAKPDGPAQVRVSSGTATYFNATRTAQFDGGVRLVTDEATMQGQHAELLLAPSTSAGKAGTGATPPYAGAVTRAKTAGNASGMTFGAVERAVITGAVQVQQPDRKATGERLVYTAADGLFVMTGTPGHWPSVTDAAQGTTTGESIRFRTGDRSVTVLGSGNRRTHVESHLENQRR